MENFHGITAVVVTHFTDTHQIDYSAISKHINWLINSGIHALLPVGATGEFASLSLQERKTITEFVIKEVAGRVPVMVGAVSQNIDDVIEISKHAKEVGAQAVMVLSPPALHMSQEEIYAFYETVSANINIDVMIYNNPGSAAVDIHPETMAQIVKLPNMTYLKESTGDMVRMTRMVDELSSDIITLCGCECLAYESFVIGAKGWISVLSNIAPKMCVQLYDLTVEKKDLEKARNLYKTMIPMLRHIEESGELWQITKYALMKQGIGNGLLRKPRLPISSGAKAIVDDLMMKTKFE